MEAALRPSLLPRGNASNAAVSVVRQESVRGRSWRPDCHQTVRDSWAGGTRPAADCVRSSGRPQHPLLVTVGSSFGSGRRWEWYGPAPHARGRTSPASEDEARLAMLRSCGVLDAAPDAELDRWTAALRRTTGAAVTALCFADSSRRLAKSVCTAAGPAERVAGLALTESLESYLAGLAHPAGRRPRPLVRRGADRGRRARPGPDRHRRRRPTRLD